MTRRGSEYTATVLSRTLIDPQLARLELGGEGLTEFASTNIPDEWVGLVVPGQFQSRYYTVRSWDGGRLVLDVVLHASGLVTQWAAGDCVGDEVTLQQPQGSFSAPADAAWVWLVGDLTALPAMARIAATLDPQIDLRVWAEAPAPIPGYFPDALTDTGRLTWLASEPGGSRLASVVDAFDWPPGAGHFWMAGESAQMRAIRRHLMRGLADASFTHDVMGYWRDAARAPRRAADPGPIYRAGKAAGKSDAEIWADYDAQRS